MGYTVPRGLANKPFRCPFGGGANRGAVGASRGAAARSNSSTVAIATTGVGRSLQSNASSNESDASNENDSTGTDNDNVPSVVASTNVADTNSSSLVVARKPSPGIKRKNDGKSGAAPETKAVKRAAPAPPKSVGVEKVAPTPAEPKNAPSSQLAASSPTSSLDNQKMPSAETASVLASEMQLQSLSKDSYFTELECGMEPEAFVECARALCGGDAKKLAGMIVATARFHMDRCDNQLNLTEFLQKYHDALSGAFVGLSNVSNLRNFYNNNAANATIPTRPPLPLPPCVVPVNVHPLGAVGQHCGRGAEACVALRNGNVPVFALVSVSLGGGSGSVNQQYCATCNDCFEEIGFDPTKTFEGKAAFDTYMTTYATRHNFKLTKETGAKVSVGSAKVPKYVAVHCSKKSAHRRGSDCTCSFKVSAVLREKGDGTHEYKLNKIELAHSS